MISIQNISLILSILKVSEARVVSFMVGFVICSTCIANIMFDLSFWKIFVQKNIKSKKNKLFETDNRIVHRREAHGCIVKLFDDLYTLKLRKISKNLKTSENSLSWRIFPCGSWDMRNGVPSTAAPRPTPSVLPSPSSLFRRR